MLRLVKAKIIRERILKYDCQNWQYDFENGIHLVCIFQKNWQALIWRRPSYADFAETLTYDCGSFLAECRSLSCAHVMDVWVDGLGKVLSAYFNGLETKIVSFRSGEWEETNFNLPSLKTKREQLKAFARSNDRHRQTG